MNSKIFLIMFVIFLIGLPLVYAAVGVNVAGQSKGGVATASNSHVTGPIVGINAENGATTWWDDGNSVPESANITFEKEKYITNITVDVRSMSSLGTSHVNVSCWDSTNNKWIIKHTFQAPGVGVNVILYFNNTNCFTTKIRWFAYDGTPNSIINEIYAYNGTYSNPSNTFTITALDRYDSSSINNFSVTISNTTFTLSNSTQTGSITTQAAVSGIYNITITSNNTGGYFNKTYLNYNVSSDLTAELFQSVVNLNITDKLTGNSIPFTVKTNYSTFISSNGYVLLYSKNGTYHSLNISSTKYPNLITSYSIGALQNLTLSYSLSPIFNFYLRREADNSLFDIASTNSTKLTIYCPEKNIVINFRNATYNSTQENQTVDCQYSLMKIDVSYSDGSSYFRTLIPETYQTNVTWYLLDLNKDTGVQKILEMIDMTGGWYQGLIRLTTGVGSTNREIIEQYFDISTSVTLYLLKDAIYTVSIINNDGTAERQLGTLVADSAGTITITYPNIPFYPQHSILEDNVSWSYYFNTSQNVLRLTYVDISDSTESITWNIYNGINSSDLLQSFTSSLSEVTFSYMPIYFNRTYSTVLFIKHSLLSYNITDKRIFGSVIPYGSSLEGYTAEEETTIWNYVCGIFFVLWGLMFSAKHAGIGLSSTFAWIILFELLGWIAWPTLWIGLMGFLAVGAWIYEIWRTT